MDDDKIIDVMARAIYESPGSNLLMTQDHAFPLLSWEKLDFKIKDHFRFLARDAWDAAKAALAEEVREPLRVLEAAARMAEEETLTAPNAPGWPAVRVVLRRTVEFRAMLLAALDQR